MSSTLASLQSIRSPGDHRILSCIHVHPG